ncbi:MAG TPA: hypothetical protein PK595_03025 [Bacteroidota bacterium]|jgi:hypothetical protein|nr:hypothetical protein [Bacteroidota bacterium]
MDMIETPAEVKTLTTIFKQCPLCGKIWRTSDEFLQDPELHLNGYQGSLFRLFEGRDQRGLLLFTHVAVHCGTTLAFNAEEFRMTKKNKHP